MARIARAVVPQLPHHVTQRGNRRQPSFFCPSDYARYLDLMSDSCRRAGVEIWAYCLMPNHVHLIAVPSTREALARAIGEAHQRYTVAVNGREQWTGHLWQGRFASFAMDARHTIAAARYIELNPVRAGLVATAASYEWSSARAHLAAVDDVLVAARPLLERVADWSDLLRSASDVDDIDRWRKHEKTGRPIGSDEFIEQLEVRLARSLKSATRGRRPARSTSDVLRRVSPIKAGLT